MLGTVRRTREATRRARRTRHAREPFGSGASHERTAAAAARCARIRWPVTCERTVHRRRVTGRAPVSGRSRVRVSDGRNRFAPLIPVTHWSDRTAPCMDRSTTTMIGTDTISRVIGQDVYDESGEKIGSAAEVYLDDETGQPEWVTVRTGLFGTKESFVPIRNADLTDDGVRVPVSKTPGEGRPEDRHRRAPVAAGGAGALPLLRHGRRHGHRRRPHRDGRTARRHHRPDTGRTDTDVTPAPSATTPPARRPTTP